MKAISRELIRVYDRLASEFEQNVEDDEDKTKMEYALEYYEKCLEVRERS